LSDRDAWRQALFAHPWKVVEQPAGDLVEILVVGGTALHPLPVCTVGILTGLPHLDAVGRALAEAISQVPGLLRDRERLDCLLREEAGRDEMEDLILALRAVDCDYELGVNLGLRPEIHELTIDKVRAALRRHGAA
jgi:hypothetical protein